MTNAANEQARLLKQAIESEEKAKAERAALAAQSKRNMNLGETLKLTGKTKPGFIGMTLRAVFWQKDGES